MQQCKIRHLLKDFLTVPAPSGSKALAQNPNARILNSTGRGLTIAASALPAVISGIKDYSKPEIPNEGFLQRYKNTIGNVASTVVGIGATTTAGLEMMTGIGIPAGIAQMAATAAISYGAKVATEKLIDIISPPVSASPVPGAPSKNAPPQAASSVAPGDSGASGAGGRIVNTFTSFSEPTTVSQVADLQVNEIVVSKLIVQQFVGGSVSGGSGGAQNVVNTFADRGHTNGETHVVNPLYGGGATYIKDNASGKQVIATYSVVPASGVTAKAPDGSVTPPSAATVPGGPKINFSTYTDPQDPASSPKISQSGTIVNNQLPISPNFTADDTKIDASARSVEQLNTNIAASSSSYGVSPELLKAIILKNNPKLDSSKIETVNGTQRIGLMGVTVQAARQVLGPEYKNVPDEKIAAYLQNDKNNLMVGSLYMRQLMAQTKGDASLALGWYQSGSLQNARGETGRQFAQGVSEKTTTLGGDIARPVITNLNAMPVSTNASETLSLDPKSLQSTGVMPAPSAGEQSWIQQSFEETSLPDGSDFWHWLTGVAPALQKEKMQRESLTIGLDPGKNITYVARAPEAGEISGFSIGPKAEENYIEVAGASGVVHRLTHIDPSAASQIKKGQKVQANEALGPINNVNNQDASKPLSLQWTVTGANGQHIDPLKWMAQRQPFNTPESVQKAEVTVKVEVDDKGKATATPSQQKVDLSFPKADGGGGGNSAAANAQPVRTNSTVRT